MRAQEFLNEDLDEGLKGSLAAAGLTAAMALGGGAAYQHYKQTHPTTTAASVGKVAPAPAKRKEPETYEEMLRVLENSRDEIKN